MYSFLRQPRWMAFLLLGLAAAISMPMLGVWQFNRYHEVQNIQADVLARTKATPVPLRALVRDNLVPTDPNVAADTGTAPSIPGTPPAADKQPIEWLRVTATGTWDLDRQVLVDNQTYNSHPGYWVLTPFIPDDGPTILVNRGWYPQELKAGGPVAQPPRPPERQTIVARIRRTPQKSKVSITIPAGTQPVMGRLDIPRIAQQLPYRVAPVYLEQTEPAVEEGSNMRLVELPTGNPGSNLSYAMQWFVFTVIGLIAWPIIIRREAGRRARGTPKK